MTGVLMVQLNISPRRTSAALGMPPRSAFAALLLGVACLMGGCRKEDMAQQPRYDPMQPSGFFSDGESARPLVAGTVARNHQVTNSYDYDPKAGEAYGGNFPPGFPHDGDELRQRLERGRERYTIYCSVCHGELGDGKGMIVQRGFTRPPAFYSVASDASDPDLFRREQRLEKEPPGYFYNVMTNGYGAMYSYAARVKPEDRWAVAAYIQALRLSQHAEVAKLSDEDRKKIDLAKAGPVDEESGEPTGNKP